MRDIKKKKPKFLSFKEYEVKLKSPKPRYKKVNPIIWRKELE